MACRIHLIGPSPQLTGAESAVGNRAAHVTHRRFGPCRARPQPLRFHMNDSALSFVAWAVMFAAGFSGVIDLISMLFDRHPTATVASSSRHMQRNDRAQVCKPT
jgi:hypothetical protein